MTLHVRNTMHVHHLDVCRLLWASDTSNPCFLHRDAGWKRIGIGSLDVAKKKIHWILFPNKMFCDSDMSLCCLWLIIAFKFQPQGCSFSFSCSKATGSPFWACPLVLTSLWREQIGLSWFNNTVEASLLSFEINYHTITDWSWQSAWLELTKAGSPELP